MEVPKLPSRTDWKRLRARPASLAEQRKLPKSLDLPLRRRGKPRVAAIPRIMAKEYKRQLARADQGAAGLKQLMQSLKSKYLRQSEQRLRELSGLARSCARNSLQARKRVPTPATDYYSELREENLDSNGLRSAFDDYDLASVALLLRTKPGEPERGGPRPASKGPSAQDSGNRLCSAGKMNTSFGRSFAFEGATDDSRETERGLRESFSFSRNLQAKPRSKAANSRAPESQTSVLTSKKPFYKVPDYFNRSGSRRQLDNRRGKLPFFLRGNSEAASQGKPPFHSDYSWADEPHSTYFGNTSTEITRSRRAPKPLGSVRRVN